MDADVVELCVKGIFSKLPFLLEEREEASLKSFFANPSSEANVPTRETSAESVASDPISVSDRAEILQRLLKKIKQDGSLEWWQKLPAKSRASIIVFLGESADGLQLWSNRDCSCIVEKICHELLNGLDRNFKESVDDGSEQNGLSVWFRTNHDDSLTPSETDFHQILCLVRGKFSKTDWKYYPASVHAFRWIVEQTFSPLIANFVDMIIPPALLFSDDHYDDFKIAGLKILAHIVENNEKSDLVRNNWANVIYDAVQRHLSDKDPVVIHFMMSILMKILVIIEKNPAASSSEFTRYDSLLKQILFQMEFCSDLPQKKIWLPILNEYMNTLGLATLHWSDKICDVLREYTTCSDANIWNRVLDVTATLIKNTWVKVDAERISEIILRVIFNVSSFHAVCLQDSEKNEILDKASSDLKLLRKCDDFGSIKDQLAEFTKDGNSEQLHPAFIESVKQILTN